MECCRSYDSGDSLLLFHLSHIVDERTKRVNTNKTNHTKEDTTQRNGQVLRERTNNLRTVSPVVQSLGSFFPIFTFDSQRTLPYCPLRSSEFSVIKCEGMNKSTEMNKRNARNRKKSKRTHISFLLRSFARLHSLHVVLYVIPLERSGGEDSEEEHKGTGSNRTLWTELCEPIVWTKERNTRPGKGRYTPFILFLLLLLPYSPFTPFSSFRMATR